MPLTAKQFLTGVLSDRSPSNVDVLSAAHAIPVEGIEPEKLPENLIDGLVRDWSALEGVNVDNLTKVSLVALCRHYERPGDGSVADLKIELNEALYGDLSDDRNQTISRFITMAGLASPGAPVRDVLELDDDATPVELRQAAANAAVSLESPVDPAEDSTQEVWRQIAAAIGVSCAPAATAATLAAAVEAACKKKAGGGGAGGGEAGGDETSGHEGRAAHALSMAKQLVADVTETADGQKLPATTILVSIAGKDYLAAIVERYQKATSLLEESQVTRSLVKAAMTAIAAHAAATVIGPGASKTTPPPEDVTSPLQAAALGKEMIPSGAAQVKQYTAASAAIVKLVAKLDEAPASVPDLWALQPNGRGRSSVSNFARTLGMDISQTYRGLPDFPAAINAIQVPWRIDPEDMPTFGARPDASTVLLFSRLNFSGPARPWEDYYKSVFSTAADGEPAHWFVGDQRLPCFAGVAALPWTREAGISEAGYQHPLVDSGILPKSHEQASAAIPGLLTKVGRMYLDIALHLGAPGAGGPMLGLAAVVIKGAVETAKGLTDPLAPRSLRVPYSFQRVLGATLALVAVGCAPLTPSAALVAIIKDNNGFAACETSDLDLDGDPVSFTTRAAAIAALAGQRAPALPAGGAGKASAEAPGRAAGQKRADLKTPHLVSSYSAEHKDVKLVYAQRDKCWYCAAKKVLCPRADCNKGDPPVYRRLPRVANGTTWGDALDAYRKL
jgi:hypothetical protein